MCAKLPVFESLKFDFFVATESSCKISNGADFFCSGSFLAIQVTLLSKLFLKVLFSFFFVTFDFVHTFILYCKWCEAQLRLCFWFTFTAKPIIFISSLVVASV